MLNMFPVSINLDTNTGSPRVQRPTQHHTILFQIEEQKFAGLPDYPGGEPIDGWRDQAETQMHRSAFTFSRRRAG
jgi:predicted secreted protein